MARPIHAVRVQGHALRWGKSEWCKAHPGPDDDYDPCGPCGPWTAECECGGWSQQVRTRDAGVRAHRTHKRRTVRLGVNHHGTD